MREIPRGIGLALLLATSTVAQTAATTSSFEVADVHVSADQSVPFMDIGFVGSRYEIRHASMMDLITTAYEVDSELVSGGPAWLEKQRFDIIAKVSPRVPEAERRQMLQALLADRFKLTLHQEKRPLDVFVLTSGKHVQMKPSEGEGRSSCQGPPPSEGRQPYIVLNCQHMTMDEFAVRFHQMAGGYVTHTMVNQTTLEGAYDFTIKWSNRGDYRPPQPGDTDPNPGISFFDAVDKQLGLKLTADKRPIPALVVDTVNETPTPNAPDVTSNLPAMPTEFEVASVKANKSGQQGTSIVPKAGGRIEITNATLKLMIALAWSLERDQNRIVGGPKWTDSDRFDVIAKTSAFPENAPPPFDAVRVMVRSLLQDRFKIAAHMEDQQGDTWNFVVAKGGPKMKQADPANRPGCKPSQAAPTTSGTPMLEYLCQNTTMAQLLDGIRNVAGGYVDRPAVDMTGLKDAYDFTIRWTPRNALLNSGDGSASAADPSGGISFFDAVEKQLGIRMESGKQKISVLVIDHVEQPTEN
jgi:uncharacterized protein (TIGR03435 family)